MYQKNKDAIYGVKCLEYVRLEVFNLTSLGLSTQRTKWFF
ncbi:MAG: hypothetical protein BWX49_01196 [Bacteroidetes bacterium ADurb.Bin008]|jgi:hypothetical protein|nr:MAG: hypothetical protein BWX49_01196 [Bacteroidetes bacterium ADurb.Bin008]